MDKKQKKGSLKGFLGGILFSLIAIFIWLLFSSFGLVGYWSAPAFGVLIPLGYKLLLKNEPDTLMISASTVIIIIAVFIAAYLGYVLNTYILLIYEGSALSEITFSEVNDFIKSCWLYNANGFRKDCLREVGIGFLASLIFEWVYIVVLKRIKKSEVKNG
jgi:hypothetical protein